MTSKNKHDSDQVNVFTTQALAKVKQVFPNADIGLCGIIPRKGNSNHIHTVNETATNVNKFFETLYIKDEVLTYIDEERISTSWELLAANINTTTLKGLLCEKDYTDDWPLGRIQDKVFQVAYFWICILDYVDSDPHLTYKYNVQNCIENVHLHCSNVSAFVRKIKKLKEKVQKKKQKELLYNSVLEVTKIEQIGVECKKQGTTEKWLLNPEEINVGFVSKKLIFELRHYKRRNNVTDKTFGLWIKHICELESIPHLGSLWLNIHRIFNKKKNKLKLEERDDFLNGEYQPSLAPKEVDPNIELHCRECCKQAQVNKITCNIGKVVNEAKKN
ncbi:unnamed protein product [Mytilus coruscus]|uniref:Uncharacterized protein n=1 Tax=Mytilus coruscus TaxID=42192 RepID=A0A6J8AIN2_MYTCO|nr:unnamed protein product [Mytilus coruscus]